MLRNTEKYENYHENSTSVLGPDVAGQKSTSFIVKTPFKSIAEHRKVRELPRKMNIEEVEEPETTKIYRQNPRAPAAATRKLRKFTDEANMQARNHENSDEFRTQPVRHLDLATRLFTITVRTPSVTTLFGEKVYSSILFGPVIPQIAASCHIKP